MNPRQRKVAQRLAQMASDSRAQWDGIKYTPLNDEPVLKQFGITSYPMLATSPDGRTWKYYLYAEMGSYGGHFEPQE